MKCSKVRKMNLRREIESPNFSLFRQPALHLISRQQMEKLRDAEEQLQQLNETLVHFDDVIAQHRQELASLMSTVTAIDVAAEQSKQVGIVTALSRTFSQ